MHTFDALTGVQIHAGVAPAGQREWRWVASQLGQATFPADFPDTQSGWEYDLLRATDDAAERKLRPNGLYPSPIAMHWHLVGTGIFFAIQTTFDSLLKGDWDSGHEFITCTTTAWTSSAGLQLLNSFPGTVCNANLMQT